MLVSCGDRAPSEHATAKQAADIEIEHGLAIAKRLAEERRQREKEDTRIAPFGSDMKLESLTTADKRRLCGDDYHRIAVGWPIKKALACAGDRFRLVSDSSGGARIWQDCISGTAMCLTVGELDGRVSTWNR